MTRWFQEVANLAIIKMEWNKETVHFVYLNSIWPLYLSNIGADPTSLCLSRDTPIKYLKSDKQNIPISNQSIYIYLNV